MANQKHLDILKQGVDIWNRWRNKHPKKQPDLSGARLDGKNLSWANLREADLREATLASVHCFNTNFTNANLGRANFSNADLLDTNFTNANLSRTILTNTNFFHANLSSADLSQAYLLSADLREADLSGANLSRAILTYGNLSGANLSSADLREADLRQAILVGTNLKGANLTHCFIYGISAWNVELEGAKQDSLVITSHDEPSITIDNLKIAQFIYLLLNNQEIREVIDTIGQKGVLILGRFSKDRKPILDALREKLRTLNYVPIVFDFELPTERDFTETIMTLAGLCRFIIADITNPSSAPLELQATVPNYMIPFVPIIQQGERPFAMFRDLQSKYSWVLGTLEYDTSANLIKGLERAVVDPALVKHKELMEKKVANLPTRHIGDYL